MSVTIEDLREQNERLAKVIRQLDQENATIMEQAKANLEKVAVEQAKEMEKTASKTETAALQAKTAAEKAQTAVQAVPVRAALLSVALVTTAIFLVFTAEVEPWRMMGAGWLLYVGFETIMYLYR